MSPTTLADYYEVMAISPSADSAAIRSAYRKLAKVRHPDKRKKDESNATAEFKLVRLVAILFLHSESWPATDPSIQLHEAYQHLSDDTKRRAYDMIYESTILPRKLKDRRVAALEKNIRHLNDKRKGIQISLSNAKKDLFRLYAERDSLKGEKERIQKEKAAAEAWWPYICSFMPSKAAEFMRQKEQRERANINLIGKQRTKETHIDRQLTEIRSLEADMDLISRDEDKINAEIQRIEKN
jgi:curved DNA-binding protein CbpA